jgi:hypothetical protein
MTCEIDSARFLLSSKVTYQSPVLVEVEAWSAIYDSVDSDLMVSWIMHPPFSWNGKTFKKYVDAYSEI